ncbi:hypothetical protein ACSBR2_027809 [Camellia fascicularis]
MQFLMIWPFGTDYRVVETIMLKLPAFNSNESQQLLPHNLHFSLLQTSKTQHEVAQLHSLSIKTNAFHHPSISSRLLALYTDPKINNLDYARSLFDRIEEPTLFSWNTMIKCYVENHRSHEALVLFNELLSGSAFMPDDFTLPCVIKGCARLGAAEEGKQIHGLVLKIGFGLDMYVQSSLVSMYSKCGEIDLAQKVFDKMEERDLVSWNSLMDGYARCGGIEIALELFDEMPERDAVSWTVLIDGFSKSGKVDEARKWDKVSQVRETMKKKGLKKDPGYSAIEHKGLLHEFVVGDKSHPQIEKIYSKLSEMRERLKRMGHVPDTSQVLLCVEGEKDKEAELENHSERLAISFGLINVEPGSPIRIMKNLRVCNDCHSVTKLLSKIYDREIIVRDNSRFHHFKDGLCSCMDYW